MRENRHLVRDYHDLVVYRDAFTLAMEIFERSKRWPAEERTTLTDPVRCSSRSVCASIAEAWHLRPYPSLFAERLGDASNQAAHTIVWIEFAEALGLLYPAEALELSQRLRAILDGLATMQADLDVWCAPSGTSDA